MVIGGSVAIVPALSSSAASNVTYKACANKKSGAMRLVVKGKKCKKSERKLEWSIQGPPGIGGARGADRPDRSDRARGTYQRPCGSHGRGRDVAPGHLDPDRGTC